jgi:hypothetical protein
MRVSSLSDCSGCGAAWRNNAFVCLLAGLSLNMGCYSHGVKQPATLVADPKTAQDYYQRGTYFHNHAQYLEAGAEYTQAIALDKEYADAYFKRGLCRSCMDDYEGAVADLRKAIELNPKQVYQAFLARSPAANEVWAVGDTFLLFGLIGVATDPLGSIKSAHATARGRENVEEMITLCEAMLQPNDLPTSRRPLQPGLTKFEALRVVLTTDRLVAGGGPSNSDRTVLVTVGRAGPVEERLLSVLVFDKGRLTLEKHVPLHDVMEIPGVSTYKDITSGSPLLRQAVLDKVSKTDHVLYEDNRQIVAVTEWATKKGKRVRFFNFNNGKLASQTRGSRRLW